jgi:hypothetical protein
MATRRFHVLHRSGWIGGDDDRPAKPPGCTGNCGQCPNNPKLHKEKTTVTTQLKRNVPDVPVMRWNRDGTPDFNHMNQPDPVVEEIRANKEKEEREKRLKALEVERKKGVPAVPAQKWNWVKGVGAVPDFSHLND